MERALKINEKQFVSDHPAVARDLNNLAHVLWDLDDREAARKHWKRALEICIKRLGENHPHTLDLRKKVKYLDEG